MSSQPRTFRIGAVSAGFATPCLELGPTHPCGAGALTLDCLVDSEIVVAVDPVPGGLHRGAEKLFEVRDYRQALGLADRHDWQAPVFGELLVARLVETHLGIGVPPRATWIRTLLAEHFRVASHLGFLTFVGWRLGRDDLGTDGVRELLRRRTEELTGNRVHPLAVRLGGVAVDPDPTWIEAERATLAAASHLAAALASALAESGLGRGVAPLTPDAIAGYGLAGPVARASGVAADLRVDAPDLAYAALSDLLTPPEAPTGGDAHARLAWLAAETVQSAALAARCLDELPPGETTVRLPQTIQLPEGDAWVALEAPLGRAAIFATSRGDRTPWRLSLRTPSLANVSAWPAVLPGTRVADLDIAVASLPYVPGDLDK